MHSIVEIVFWIALAIIFYTYFGYSLILNLLPPRKRMKASQDNFLPVSIIIPVYNEEATIEKKIQNCYSLNYPPDLLSIIVVNDGSTDNTADLLKQFTNITVIHHSERMGKTAALNTAMASVNTDYVVFTDASAFLNTDAVRNFMQHYADDKVGGVSGEKKIPSTDTNSVVSRGESLYWQYESFLKRADSRFYSVVGADGALFSIKTKLFKPLAREVILDDFFISVHICTEGYDFVYEPSAYVLETASVSLQEEKKRKVRISAGCFQALAHFKQLLNPFNNFKLFTVYLSHRVLRWTACPILIPLIFLLNIVLLASDNPIYIGFFILQCVFYLLAIAGLGIISKEIRSKTLLIPSYFLFMNLSLYHGFIRYIKGNQPVTWEKTRRISI
jgi:cellulose synthase/poly-beta-1,6-N-acetylglucosamine synthase-like glycosyltransferase